MKHGKEVMIALVALFGLFILFVGMNFLKGLNTFSKGDVYYVSFKDVSGLASSSPIYADGYPVGTVRSIDYDYSHEGKTKVAIDIDTKMRIPKGSSAVIESDMLGNVRVNLLLANNPRERVEPGETIPGGTCFRTDGQSCHADTSRGADVAQTGQYSQQCEHPVG